jgi:hypothetical protein
MDELIVDDHNYFPRLNDNINCWRPAAVQEFPRLWDSCVVQKLGDPELVRRQDSDDIHRINDVESIERPQDSPWVDHREDNPDLERISCY